MEMTIDFPGGARVDAHFDAFTVATDQPVMGGGEEFCAQPVCRLFSVYWHLRRNLCAGFLPPTRPAHRGYSHCGTHLAQRGNRHGGSNRAGNSVPPTFPEKYYEALVRSADQCAVKKHLENPPKFKVFTKAVG